MDYDNTIRVHVAVLQHQIKELEEKVTKMEVELDSIRSKGFMISGGIALTVIIGGFVGWLLNAAEKISKIKIP